MFVQRYSGKALELPHDEAAASNTLHTILLGVGGFVYIPSHTLDPLKKLGFGFHKVNKLGLKLHAHSV